jgi:hypothetical protein
MHVRASEGQLRYRIPATVSLNSFHSVTWPTAFVVAVVPQLHIPKHLSGRTPDALEEAILLCEPVEAVVGLAHGADEATEGVDLVVTGVAAVLVNLADGDLDGSVVLGLDDASGGRLECVSIAIRGSIGAVASTHAFAGDVNWQMLAIMEVCRASLVGCKIVRNHQMRIHIVRLTVNELSAFVLHFE